MKRFALIGIMAAAAAVAMVGCEWETGSGTETWSDTYNWVNFSGTYTPFTNPNNLFVIEKAGIKSIAVTHRGQNLEMRDSSGNYYEGRMTWIQTASGSLPTPAGTNGVTFPNNAETDRVLAQYEVTGGGARLVGTFEGYLINNVLRDRVMLGTWVKGSKSDTIQGAAPAMVLDERPTDSAFSEDNESDTGSEVIPDVVPVVPAP